MAMPSEVFIDTGAWYAVADTDDGHHGQARKAYFDLLLKSYLVTTNLVLAETYALVLGRKGVAPALRFLETVRESPRIEIVYSTRELEGVAEGILLKYADHPFSYTDATSFACMQTRGITDAFTFDQHFAIAGFQMIPRND